jgi:hypothetical protein
MTLDEFNVMAFSNKSVIRYDGEEYPVAGVDFTEALIGIHENLPGSDEDVITWKRCENCELVSLG